MEIEDGIPMPTAKTRIGKYDWSKFEVGQSSFFASPPKLESVLGSAKRYGKKNSMTFIAATAEKDGVAGTRVWRQS